MPINNIFIHAQSHGHLQQFHLPASLRITFADGDTIVVRVAREGRDRVQGHGVAGAGNGAQVATCSSEGHIRK